MSDKDKNKNTKHLLFYSNYCNYSNEIYQTIIKYNLKDEFHLINISKYKYNLPSIITSVPTLLLDDKKTIYQNNELDDFLQKLHKEKSKDDILPNSDYTQSFSTSFSSWDEKSNINDVYNPFGLINGSNNIETPTEDKKTTNGNTSLTDQMNSIQESRNMDIQNIFKKKPQQI